MKRYALALWFLSSVCVASGAESLSYQNAEIRLPNGRRLVLEETNSRGSLYVIYLPGSGASLFPGQESLWLRTFADAGHKKILVINKSGVSLTGVTQFNEFNRGSVRCNRIADIRYVLKKRVPQDAEIWLVGESEGAYIAPDIALKDPRVKKLFLVSAGTRSWISEEVSFAAPEKQAAVRKFLEANVVGHPSITKTYDGWTYAQLDSYNTSSTYRSLRHLEIPVLMLNGQKDLATWVAATTADAFQLIQNEDKSNIEFHLIPEANHSLGCSALNAACDPDVTSRFEVQLFESFMSTK